MEKIKFMSDEMQEIEFFVLEQTKVNGISYILVTDSEKDDELRYDVAFFNAWSFQLAPQLSAPYVASLFENPSYSNCSINPV